MKATVLVCRLTYSGIERKEIGDWLVLVAGHQDERIDRTLHAAVDRCPTTAARNLCVKLARRQGADVLVMVDADMAPSADFYPRAVDFLLRRAAEGKPSVVASPYVCAPPDEGVQVIRYASRETGHPAIDDKLTHVPREEAAQKTGVEQVAAVGTGLIAFDVRVFDRVTEPYFRYQYEDEAETAVSCTEDVYLTRDLTNAGVGVFVDWDSWSGHAKTKVCGKPHLIPLADVPLRLMREAKAQLRPEAGPEPAAKIERQLAANGDAKRP